MLPCRPRRTVLAGLAALALVLVPLRAAAGELLVFAASTLTEALTRIAEGWQAETGQRVLLSFGGSPVMARQIQAGAPADLFISASPDWMDALEGSGDLRPGTRRDLLTTSLVLIAADPDAPPVALGPDLDLVALLGGGRLAMGLVDAVPAGVYGRAALDSLGLWASVEAHLAQAYSVRGALAFVAQGEAPLGIVYATDAAAEPRVRVIAAFPDDSHPPIRFPAAITAQSRHPQAGAFLDHLASDPARAVWAAHGFREPGP